jgi:hypothetical protein
MHERALETHEASCVPRIAKHFFIPVVHRPPGAVGHVTAPELPSHECRVPSHVTRGSTEAPLLGRQSPEPWTHDSTGAQLFKEARSGAEGHVAVPKLTQQ